MARPSILPQDSPYARVARAETLTVRSSDYIAAVKLQGAGPIRVIWGHIIPMCLPSVIIRVTTSCRLPAATS